MSPPPAPVSVFGPLEPVRVSLPAPPVRLSMSMLSESVPEVFVALLPIVPVVAGSVA